MIKKLFPSICFIFCGIVLLLPGAVLSATCTTTVPAGIVVNQTWTEVNSPYCITGDIQVSLLTIEPGVEVLVDGPYKIDVLSIITAIGTEEKPILFSAKEPLDPDNQRWKGIRFQDTPPGSEFTHAIIEYSDARGLTIVNSTPSFNDCIIRNNSSTGSGGGIYASISSGDLVINNCTIANNTSTGSNRGGGGIYATLSAGTLFLDSSEVSDNYVGYSGTTYADGGGIYIVGDMEVTNSVIRGNTSYSRRDINNYSRGGGIHISSGNVKIETSSITDNLAQSVFKWTGVAGKSHARGGGVYVNSGTLVTANTKIGCNTTSATSVAGTGIYVNSGNMDGQNMTIARNSHYGISRAGGDATISNSIVYFNNNNEIQISGAVNATYSDIQGTPVYPGEGNINFNPVFAGLECSAGDLDIVAGSLAIDGGNTDPVNNDADLPPGLMTTTNDMGAYGGPGNSGWLNVDSDGDGISDPEDNCPKDPNANQVDEDNDGIGDSCTTIGPTTNPEDCTTIVPEGIVVNETWTAEGSPYCVTGDIHVSLLIVEPGVEVLVDGPYKIEVLSTITAIGAAAEPILFSVVDPVNQRWTGIRFQDTPPGSEFRHVIIEYSDARGVTIVNSTPSFNDCIIRNNSSTGSGGGIYASISSGDLFLNNCTIADNTSNGISRKGGGIYANLSTGTLFLDSSEVSGNYVGSSGTTYSDGGGIYLVGDMEVTNSVIRSNTSYSRRDINNYSRGGGIHISSGNVKIETSSITDNLAQSVFRWTGVAGQSHARGGGVYVNSGTLVTANTKIGCNTTSATSVAGTGIYVNSGNMDGQNMTIAHNSHYGLSRTGGNATLSNSIVYFNNNNATQISGTVNATYSDIQGTPVYPGEGNINFNPVFAGLECSAGDLTPMLGSLALDGGNPDPAYNDACLPPGQMTERNDMGATGGPGNCGCSVPLLGDMNDDCTVDINDVILVLRMALDLDQDDPCADVDGNGVVDISDVILTLRMALGLDPLQACNGL